MTTDSWGERATGVAERVEKARFLPVRLVPGYDMAEVDELLILWSAEQILEFGLPVDALARAIVVNDEIEHRWLAPYCREVVRTDGPEEAIAALSA